MRRVGHEAGSLSPWLHTELLAEGVPAVCLETRHVRAALSAQRNKTDATDALGIAHIMRTGWFRQAHIKTEACYRIRLLLVQRRNLKRKFLDLENAIRHSLKVFGIKLGKVSRGNIEKAVRASVADDAMTAGLMDCILRARAALWTEYLTLNKLVVQIAMRDELCRRFMAIPGVGPVTALSFSSAIDDPDRFRRSRNVAAYFGLTPKRWQSGSSIDVQGRISKAGDPDVRRALYEAASAIRCLINSFMMKISIADSVSRTRNSFCPCTPHRPRSVDDSHTSDSIAWSGDIETHTLGKRKVTAIVDVLRLASHVYFPGIRTGFTASAGFLLAPECAADLGAAGPHVDICDPAIRPGCRQKCLGFAEVGCQDRR